MEFIDVLEEWIEIGRKKHLCPFDFMRCSESCGILFPKYRNNITGTPEDTYCPCIVYGVDLVELRVRYFLRYNK